MQDNKFNQNKIKFIVNIVNLILLIPLIVSSFVVIFKNVDLFYQYYYLLIAELSLCATLILSLLVCIFYIADLVSYHNTMKEIDIMNMIVITIVCGISCWFQIIWFILLGDKGRDELFTNHREIYNLSITLIVYTMLYYIYGLITLNSFLKQYYKISNTPIDITNNDTITDINNNV